MTSDVIQKIRSGSLDNDLEYFQKLISDVKSEQKDIDIPNKSELFTQKITVNDDPEGNLNVNGNWVHPIYAKISNMLNSGLSPIICVVGKEGLGKSMTGLQLAYTLSDKIQVLRNPLNIQNQVVYRPLEFLFLERESTRTAQLFEEANETLNPNDYHSIFNRAVAGSIRTQRKRENCKIFIAPELQKIDPRIREKADIVIELKNEQYAEITTYKKRHAKRSSRGMDYYFNNGYPDWRIPDVPDDLKNEYDEIDNEYKGDYLDELILKVLEERIDQVSDQNLGSI